MSRPDRRRPARPLAFEPLEGRALMSQATFVGPLPPRMAQIWRRPPRTSQIEGITTDPKAVAAILAALRGGPGNEFATVLRRQVPNVRRVVSDFVTGRRTEFAVRGVAFQIPNFSPSYTGPHLDNVSITGSGAVAQRGNVLQVGTILLGPFDEDVTTEVVFGIDRGSGRARGPIFAERPGLTPDTLITLTVGPNGSTRSGTVTDLNTGAVTPLDPARIQTNGSTIRAFVPLSLLPSTGARLGRYRFANWTRNASLDGSGFETVGSLALDGRMVPLGLLGASPRLRPGLPMRSRR